MKFEKLFWRIVITIMTKLSIHFDSLCKGFFFRAIERIIRETRCYDD